MRESKEEKISLKRFDEDIPIEAFKILLKYAYSGKMHLEADQLDLILDVLGLVDKYAFNVATRKISEFLKVILSLSHSTKLIPQFSQPSKH